MLQLLLSLLQRLRPRCPSHLTGSLRECQLKKAWGKCRSRKRWFRDPLCHRRSSETPLYRKWGWGDLWSRKQPSGGPSYRKPGYPSEGPLCMSKMPGAALCRVSTLRGVKHNAHPLEPRKCTDVVSMCAPSCVHCIGIIIAQVLRYLCRPILLAPHFAVNDIIFYSDATSSRLLLELRPTNITCSTEFIIIIIIIFIIIIIIIYMYIYNEWWGLFCRVEWCVPA
eukprot:Rmarinus@m.11269